MYREQNQKSLERTGLEIKKGRTINCYPFFIKDTLDRLPIFLISDSLHRLSLHQLSCRWLPL